MLIICTGNLCRSPMAAGILRHVLAQRLGDIAGQIDVTSAGVRAVGGAPMAPLAARVLTERGVPGALDFRSCRFVPELVDAADLVLTAARSQRLIVGQERPEAYSRTFTLREFADLVSEAHPEQLPAAPAARAAALLSAVRQARAVRAPLPAHEIDIDDPIGQRLPAFRRCLASIEAAVAVIGEALAPPAGRAAS